MISEKLSFISNYGMIKYEMNFAWCLIN